MNGKPHWRSIAKNWKYFGMPLRPAIQDVRYMEEVIAKNYGSYQDGIDVKLYGVTPEIATMAWPENTRLTAIDQSLEMIDEVWPRNMKIQAEVIQGDWLDSNSNSKQLKYDVVIGDGCFISMSYPDGYANFTTMLASELNRNGRLIMRFFLQLEHPETVDQVFDALLAEKIGSFHVFKWRLAMALQTASKNGVCLRDIFHAWLQASIDEQALLEKMSWLRTDLDTIKLYENKENCFSFSTLPEIKEILRQRFYLESIYFPPYELGERCPIITLRLNE